MLYINSVRNQNQLFQIIKKDAYQFCHSTKIKSIIKLSIFHPGFRAVWLIRLTQLQFPFSRILIKMLKIHLLKSYGCDIGLGCKIGSGLRIEHPVGIVIGSGVRIGNNFTCSQNVTIGEKYIDSRAKGLYPIIGNDVNVGAGAAIIGDITVGDNVTIGAHSLILKNVNKNKTIVGILT